MTNDQKRATLLLHGAYFMATNKEVLASGNERFRIKMNRYANEPMLCVRPRTAWPIARSTWVVRSSDDLGYYEHHEIPEHLWTELTEENIKEFLDASLNT